MFGKLARLSVALFSATIGLAQMRAPCTGIVRDADGRPLANAHVVCEWQPDQIVFGTPDRHETKTDADGRFALDLWIGHAYCTWVIGPADADKSRLVVPPRWSAVGGKSLDLVARVRTSPVRLDVRGTTPWLNDGPLALRVFVALQCALPDIVLPGDGPVALPPLPTTRFTVALVDARGQVLDHVVTDADATAPCTFAPVTEVAFAVVDDHNQPVADAAIHTTAPWVSHTVPPPMQCWAGIKSARVVATTDANGRATGRVVRVGAMGESVLFVAVGPNDSSLSSPSGWVDRRRIHSGAGIAAHDDEPLPLQLTPTTTKFVRLAEPNAEFAWHVEFPAPQLWRTRSAAGSFELAIPGLPQELQSWTNLVPASTTGVHMVGFGSEAIPCRALVLTTRDTVDLTKLRTVSVRVVDTHRRGVAFARFGLQRNVKNHSGWLTHLVTDDDGHAKLVIDVGAQGTSLDAYASTDSAHGWVRLEADSELARIEVEPFAPITFCVVDAGGRPVAGAFLATSPSHGAAAFTLATITKYFVANPLHGEITSADGTVTVELPQEHLSIHMVTAHWRGKTTIPCPIRRDATDPIVLQFNP